MASITSDGADQAIMVREIDGELVALDTQANLVHQLNATASLIWRLATRGCSAEAIAAAVVSEYAVDLDTASKDVVEMLARFEALGLLVPD